MGSQKENKKTPLHRSRITGERGPARERENEENCVGLLYDEDISTSRSKILKKTRAETNAVTPLVRLHRSRIFCGKCSDSLYERRVLLLF